MNLSALTSFVASFVRVLGSTVAGKHSAVLVGGDGAIGALDDQDPGASGEQFTDVEAYGAPGIVFRPRPPETVGGDELSAEAMALRTGGGLVPVAWRDLRLNRRFSAPKPGSVALVGYGGGFLAFDDTSDKTSSATLYVPYSFSGGVPTKAHVISLDPVAESVSIVHGDGFAVVLDADNGITLRGGTSTWLNVKDGEITLVANKIVCQGNVALGAQPLAATPLTAGPVAPTRPSVFLSIA